MTDDDYKSFMSQYDIETSELGLLNGLDIESELMEDFELRKIDESQFRVKYGEYKETFKNKVTFTEEGIEQKWSFLFGRIQNLKGEFRIGNLLARQQGDKVIFFNLKDLNLVLNLDPSTLIDGKYFNDRVYISSIGRPAQKNSVLRNKYEQQCVTRWANNRRNKVNWQSEWSQACVPNELLGIDVVQWNFRNEVENRPQKRVLGIWVGHNRHVSLEGDIYSLENLGGFWPFADLTYSGPIPFQCWKTSRMTYAVPGMNYSVQNEGGCFSLIVNEINVNAYVLGANRAGDCVGIDGSCEIWPNNL